jgi:mono/diheme cytochrome c family protein
MSASGRGLSRTITGTLMLIAGMLSVDLPTFAADTRNGARLAHQWCANCHVVDNKSAASVMQGPPSFRTIARSGISTERLRIFLSHPHGSMPDLSLSRREIDDLIAYLRTFR